MKINTTTCLYFKELIKAFGGLEGQVFQMVEDGYVIVVFPTGYKMVSEKLLEVLNESR